MIGGEGEAIIMPVGIHLRLQPNLKAIPVLDAVVSFLQLAMFPGVAPRVYVSPWRKRGWRRLVQVRQPHFKFIRIHWQLLSVLHFCLIH